MNFLQLVQRLKRRCGVSGTMPTTVLNQPEELARLVDFINEAWMDIQGRRKDWLWMRAPFSFATAQGKSQYSVADVGLTDFGYYALDSFRNFVTSAGNSSEVFMDYLPYESWRDTYLYGATRYTSTRPLEFTVAPDLSIGLGPVPAQGYTVSGEYYRVPTELVNDSDLPAMPSQFHMAIVYRAMMFYGAFEAAQEVYQLGAAEFGKQMNRLAVAQLSDMQLAGALA